MNERIKQLAKQANAEFVKDEELQIQPNGTWKKIYVDNHRNLDLEKFAELIVQECVIVGNKAWLADNSTVPTFPANQIKEHFGVKE
jgi:hypothetical protein